MDGHRPELADVLREHGGEYAARYGHVTNGEQRRVVRALTACRTAALGGHKFRCEQCGQERFAYNSCRNRHCPKCQAEARAQWFEQRREELLEVEYFHVVFTIPEELTALALQNRRVVYGLLFRAVAETLQTVADDPQHLGAEIGFLAILHTWGQKLDHHPHIHCVVPGGGLAPGGSGWVKTRPGFFLPVRILSRVFRGKFLDGLNRARQRGALVYRGSLADLANAAAWARLIASARRREWVVYSKPPFGGAQQVLKYLARYTHRVAISNQRLQRLDGGRVSFSYKDYRRGQRQRTMTLEAVEFIRRFLQHVLPKGFQRIRHFGFLANRCRATKLVLCRQLLGCEQQSLPDSSSTAETATAAEQIEGGLRCPHCKGRLVIVEVLAPLPRRCDSATWWEPYDSS